MFRFLLPCNAFLLIFYCLNYYSHGILPVELLAKHIGEPRNTSHSGLSNMAELAWSKRSLILPVHKPGAVWNGGWAQKIPSKGFQRWFAFGRMPDLMLGWIKFNWEAVFSEEGVLPGLGIEVCLTVWYSNIHVLAASWNFCVTGKTDYWIREYSVCVVFIFNLLICL